MSSLRRFSDPDWLRTLSQHRLRRLLKPWCAHLSELGCSLTDQDAELDYSALAAALFRADTNSPAEMIDALYYVSETATTEDMERLLETCGQRGVSLPDDPLLSPGDCSIEVWLAEPELLQARHAESLAHRQRSFEYFQARGRRAFPEMDDRTRLQIETALDDWFETKRRGRGCRVFVFQEGRQTWALVRHGNPMRREPSHRHDGEPASEFYRPQIHDVLRYDARSGEIAIRAGTVGERNLYLATLGRVLFQNPDYFPTSRRFTLEPLQQRGADVLACSDIPGVEHIRLVEFRRFWGGEFKEMEVRRATDVFAALAQRGAGSIEAGHLTAATFKVMFTGASKERSVAIRIPAVARYERSEDSQVFEPWLQIRGFLLSRPQPEADDDHPTEVLEDA